MITKTKSYQTSDGQTFINLGEAQRHEIVILLGNAEGFAGLVEEREKIGQWAIENGAKLIDILTTKGSSKPAARAVNGGTKKRTPKPSKETAVNAPEAA